MAVRLGRLRPVHVGCDFSTDDCGGSYCVPAELGPPPFACGGTDEASCLAAGCTFVLAPPMFASMNTCECGPALPLCLWFPEAGSSVVKPTAYYPKGSNEVRLFPMEWSAPPFGWKPCAGDPEAPTDCACADACAP